MIRLTTLLCSLALAACASAPAPDATPIRDTSFTDAGNSRAIQFSTYLKATPEQVYQAVATVDGWKTWAVPAAFGEAKVGGRMETSYNPVAKAGDAANIQQEFIMLAPPRLVVFRTVRTPPGFPNQDLYLQTVSAIEIAPEGAGARITFTHSGFGQGPGFDRLYKFFHDGDRLTLEHLKKRFEAGPVDWSKERAG